MIKIGIVGGTGYTGVELLRLLASHPEADVRAITSRKDAGTQVADMFPSLRGKYSLAFVRPGADEARWRATSCSSRRRTASRWRRRASSSAPACEIIDLAADFRIKDRRRLRAVVRDAARVPRSPRRIGLRTARGQPRRDQTRAHRRQSRLLSDGRAAWLPAAARGGRRRPRASDRRLQVGRFRRRAARRRWASSSRRLPTTSRRTASRATAIIPRSSRSSARSRKAPVSLVFTPHLVPMIRGIQATLYARLTKSDVDLQALFEKRYAGEPFVDVMPPGIEPDTRSVRAANVCRIAVHRPQGGDMAVILVVAGQPRQGRRRPGDPEHEPDVRPARDHGSHRAAGPAVARFPLALPAWWRRARQHFSHRRAADGGALAPAVAVARRSSASCCSRSSAECGGGASTSARSSAASTARRSRRGSRRSKPTTRSCATEATQLRARNHAAGKRARDDRRRAGDACRSRRSSSGRERAAQGGARRSCRSSSPTRTSRSGSRFSGSRSSASATTPGTTAC